MNIRVLSHEQKSYLVGLLEMACEKLDITDTERSMAESRYNAVGKWLSDGENKYLANSTIYTQGSIRLHTTVRPIGNNEFDVDLICYLPNATHLPPSQVRETVGNRLKANETYKGMLEPLNRGWRLTYANEFHMDITPAVTDTAHGNGGVLVPDRELRDWKESHPKGYAEWFEKIAQYEPITLAERKITKAVVEPMPGDIPLAGSLRRSVQIMKRHRDLWCSKLPEAQQDDAPISIIITTLAARAYQSLVNRRYDNALDMLLDIAEAMPSFVEQRPAYPYGQESWVANPMNNKENFADKWKANPQREDAFYQWHKNFHTDLNNLSMQPGIDGIATGLSALLDESLTKSVMNDAARRLNTNRDYGRLTAAASGLIASAISKPAVAIPKNTFYGD